MTRTKMRMMEPMVVVGSIILLIVAITVVWKLYTPENKPLTDSATQLMTGTLQTSTQAASTTQAAVPATQAAATFPQFVAANFDAYQTQDPSKAITTPTGQEVARFKSLPTGFTRVSVLFPDTSAIPSGVGLIPIASVNYTGANGQIVINTIKPDQNAASQTYNLGSQQIALASGEKVWYDTNQVGQLPTRFLLQRDSLYILINTDLQPEQVASILADLTFN